MKSNEAPWRLGNRWYAAAWDSEVGRTPLARTLCGLPIVLYRRLDGRVVAMRDACPHRLSPLSMGRVEGDNLRCRYHGMMFDPEGRCVEMPAQDGVAANFQVADVYPVIERYRFVWVWIGEAPADDGASLPDLWPCEAQGWTFDGGVYHLKADYRLMIDNLMDLSHETYVHAGSIGQPEICESPIAVETDGDEVRVSRWMLGIDAPPFWRNALKRPGLVDRWQVCRFLPPSAVMIDVGVALAGTGAPEGDRSKGVNGYVINVMSPETPRTSWYFWGMARNFDIADRGFTDRFKAQQAEVFREDLEILEAQQRSIDANPDLKMRTFNIDAGGARSRMVLDRLLQAQTDGS
jgi:phenylpropionate dioxygenase-like ring-hydroxylating dioxygenase large terminal subunit